MEIVLITSIIASLFVVIGAAEPLASKLRVPYSVILALLGVLIAAAASFFLRTDLTDALNPVAAALVDLPIRSNIFLYVLLPTLLFQATIAMDLRRAIDDWVPITVLAVIAVLIATLSVGYALAWTSTLPLAVCFLIGAIVSTTDPSAVVSIFRSIAAPRRLARLVEGESLLNDAAAIALFGLFLGFVALGAPNPSLLDAVARFPLLMVGGAFTGWVLASVASVVMARFRSHELAQISLSIALPYLAFIIAEQIAGASGVIAVVAAGLTLNFAGPARLGPQVWPNLREVWDLLAHWAGALIFVLAALLIPRLLEEVRPNDILLIGVVVLAATAARAVTLFGLLPVLSWMRASPPIDQSFRVAILWGGLRGAITLALALAVTESPTVDTETKRIVGILATGFVLFTVFVQGATLRTVIGWLRLDRLSPLDAALSQQVVAVALQSVREDIARATEQYDMTHDVVRSEAKRFGDRLEHAVRDAGAGAELLDADRVALGLIALAGRERDEILAYMREFAISSAVSQRLVSDAERLIEASRSGGRSGYRRASRRNMVYNWRFRAAAVLQNRIGLGGPLGRLVGARFELLLARRLILRGLHGFIDGRIKRLHGKRVADLLHKLIDSRITNVEAALGGLRLQYPGYAEDLERQIIRRIALRLEEREYSAMRDDGLIGTEIYASLMESVRARRDDAYAPLPPDLALGGEELVRQFPLFANLGDEDLAQLCGQLEARYANPGEVVVRKNRPSRSVFFIASGAVEIESAGQTTRLGRGEMFGQISALGTKQRRVAVRSIAPSTFLVLDERRFRQLVNDSATLREAVTASAEKRGIDPEPLFAEALAQENREAGPTRAGGAAP